jgi:hypothetical protein
LEQEYASPVEEPFMIGRCAMHNGRAFLYGV